MTEGKRTVHTIVMVIALTVGSKVLGFLRDVLIGSRFGTSLESDAYFMALKITALIFMSIGSAVTTTMIPTIVHHITKGEKEKAFNFANKIFTILLIFVVVIIPLGMVLAPYYTKYIAFGFHEKKMLLTLSLTRIMFPILICTIITYIFVSLLQSFGKFSITSILSIPYNIVLIIYLAFFVSNYGIKGLAFATVIGWITQFAIQIPSLYKEQYRVRFMLDVKDQDVKNFFKLIFPIFLSTMVYNVNTIVDSSLASTLSEGKLSALTYAFIIYTAIASTTIYGISTVLFPKFAKDTSLKNYDHLKKQITSTIKFLSFILIPITVGMITLRTPIVKLAFQRGAFNEQGVTLTKLALTYYTIGMIGFGIQEVLNKGFFALKDTKTPMKFGILSVIINIGLNLILIRKLDLIGLALATSLATITNGILLYHALSRKIGKMDTKGITLNLLKVVVASLIMAGCTFAVYASLVHMMGMEGFARKVIILLSSVSIGIIVYGMTTILLKIKEANFIVEHYLKKIFYRRHNHVE